MGTNLDYCAVCDRPITGEPAAVQLYMPPRASREVMEESFKRASANPPTSQLDRETAAVLSLLLTTGEHDCGVDVSGLTPDESIIIGHALRNLGAYAQDVCAECAA